jgi:hypothetical protein
VKGAAPISSLDREQRVLARWDRLQSGFRGSKPALPLLIWGLLYLAAGVPEVTLGLAGWIAGWPPFGFGPDDPLTPWWRIGLNGLVPLGLGVVVLAGAAILTGKRERRRAWKVLLGVGGVGSVLLAVWAVRLAVHLPEAIPFLVIPAVLLFGAFPAMALMAWRRLHNSGIPV